MPPPPPSHCPKKSIDMTSFMTFKYENMAINSHQKQQQLEELSRLRRARETSDYIIASIKNHYLFSTIYTRETYEQHTCVLPR